jgi:apolipoprotein N-acyltransferase
VTKYARDLLCLVGGGVFPLSLSPFDLWPLAIFSPALLFVAVSACSIRRAIIRFYLFNLAMFAVGVSWIYVSINVYGGAPVVLSLVLVVLFVAGYAIVSVPLAFLYARFFRHSVGMSIVGFCALWVLQEWLRSWLLTGFPWLFVGYGFMGTSIAAYAPIAGIYGVSLAGVVCAICLTVAIRQRSAWFFIPVAGVVVGGILVAQFSFTESASKVTVSLVQGNVDQHSKWHRKNRQPILDRYMNATATEWGRDLVIWPEAALTVFHEQAGNLLSGLDNQARLAGSTLVLGIPDRDDDGGFQNTVIAVGNGSGQYIKRRLVPFGEYVPLEGLLRGLIRFFDLPMSRNKSGPWEQAPLTAGGLILSTSICYEVVYPDLVRRTAAAPDLLVTVSNDTWFGASIGPWQHLQMARMRAMENGRTMLRATNNGVTAVIDHKGVVVDSLPQFERGVLRGQAEVRSGLTPYHRFGSYPVLVLCLLSAIGSLVAQRYFNREKEHYLTRE